jgi:hypothetical protein
MGGRSLMANKKLLDGVALKIADYRKGEIEAPNADHVARWISQFDPKVHDPFWLRSCMFSGRPT